MRGSTQKEAQATRTVEKYIEQTYPIVTPPTLHNWEPIDLVF